MPTGVRDVLLCVAIVVAVASLAYSVAEHLQARDHITNLEDDVYGSPINGARANDGLVVLVDFVKILNDRVDKVESDTGPSSENVTLKLQLEGVRRSLCQHLADHTKYHATPVYDALEDSWCKDYVQ